MINYTFFSKSTSWAISTCLFIFNVFGFQFSAHTILHWNMFSMNTLVCWWWQISHKNKTKYFKFTCSLRTFLFQSLLNLFTSRTLIFICKLTQFWTLNYHFQCLPYSFLSDITFHFNWQTHYYKRSFSILSQIYM